MISPHKFTFLTFLITALAGLFLRALPFLPFPGLPFESIRHAHSHLAFLGWVYGAFYLAFVHFFLSPGRLESARYRRLFWATQAVSTAMFVAFLAQGYGAVSIALLTVHTVLAYVFFARLFRDWKRDWSRPSVWFAVAAMVAFILSSLGPFGIPWAKQTGDPAWARMAVHFYLHFQYDGWFVFAGQAVFYKILETTGAAFSHKIARWQAWLLLIALVPAYCLNAPVPLLPVPLLPLIAAAQWVGILLFLCQLYRVSGDGPPGRFFLYVAAAGFFLKYSAELAAVSLPLAAHLDRGNHFLVLAYLHLLFLGGVTPFIFWFSAREGWLSGAWSRRAAPVFAGGVLLSEAYLFAWGLGAHWPGFGGALLAASALLAAGAAGMFIAAGKGKEDQRVSTT